MQDFRINILSGIIQFGDLREGLLYEKLNKNIAAIVYKTENLVQDTLIFLFYRT